MVDSQQGVGQYDRTLNVVICKLPQSVNEDTAEKVNRLIKEQLHIHDVEVASAYRVESGSDRNKPEVVILSFIRYRIGRKYSRLRKSLNHHA